MRTVQFIMTGYLSALAAKILFAPSFVRLYPNVWKGLIVNHDPFCCAHNSPPFVCFDLIPVFVAENADERITTYIRMVYTASAFVTKPSCWNFYLCSDKHSEHAPLSIKDFSKSSISLRSSLALLVYHRSSSITPLK